MRQGLQASLLHLRDAGIAPLGLDEQAIAAGLERIATHRVAPGVFGRYFELVLAARSGDFEGACRLFRELLLCAKPVPSLRIVPFSKDALGDDAARYAKVIAATVAGSIGLESPASARWLNFQAGLKTAFRWLDAAAPALAAEIRAVVVEIVGAARPDDPSARTFGGAASAMLWGGILINMDHYHSPLDLFEGLVHEAAHQLLFGLAQDEPLVSNAIEERFNSPLRSDPRPMDGIFHQMFVSARLVYAFERLEASGALSAKDRSLLAERRKRFHHHFFAAHDVVARHGKVTPVGRSIVVPTLAWMQSRENPVAVG